MNYPAEYRWQSCKVVLRKCARDGLTFRNKLSGSRISPDDSACPASSSAGLSDLHRAQCGAAFIARDGLQGVGHPEKVETPAILQVSIIHIHSLQPGYSGVPLSWIRCESALTGNPPTKFMSEVQCGRAGAMSRMFRKKEPILQMFCERQRPKQWLAGSAFAITTGAPTPHAAHWPADSVGVARFEPCKGWPQRREGVGWVPV